MKKFANDLYLVYFYLFLFCICLYLCDMFQYFITKILLSADSQYEEI